MPPKQAGRVLENYEGLPPGWRAVEKTYGTGSYAGQTYVRFFSDKHSGLSSIKKVLSVYAEDIGEDPEKVIAEYEAKKEERKRAAAAEREAQGKLEGERKKEAIEAFKRKYGSLDGATVCALDGWRGESKYLPNSGQISARYYSPEGISFSLINQIEAFFGYKLLTGKESEIPDIQKARSSLVYGENGKVVNLARRGDNIQEQFTVVPEQGKQKRKRALVVLAKSDHYRETEYVKIIDLGSSSAQDHLEVLGVPDVEQIVDDVAYLLKQLGQRYGGWAPRLLYISGARTVRTPGVKVMNQFSGIYFERGEPFNDRPCYQRVLRQGDLVSCSGHHLHWSASQNLWKVGLPNEDKAGIAICREDAPEPTALQEGGAWLIFEPKLEDLEQATAEAEEEEHARKKAVVAAKKDKVSHEAAA